MASDPPPVRLNADPNASPALRALLEQARRDMPNAAALAQLGTRLDATLAAEPAGPTPHPPAPSPVAALPTSKAVGIILGLSMGALVAGSIWLVARNHAPQADQLSPAVNDSARSIASSNAPAADIAVATSPTPDALATSPAPDALITSPPLGAPVAAKSPGRPAVDKAVPRETAAVTSDSPRATNPAADEAKLLLAARSALTTDPNRALQLTQEHARRFPEALLRQEREVIAIEALQRLGQVDQARQRAFKFEKQYPSSAHRSKIEQLIKAK